MKHSHSRGIHPLTKKYAVCKYSVSWMFNGNNDQKRIINGIRFFADLSNFTPVVLWHFSVILPARAFKNAAQGQKQIHVKKLHNYVFHGSLNFN